MKELRWAVALLALGVAACGDKQEGGQASQPTAQAGPVASAPVGGWTETVTTTPDGGFLMGNPNAPVKLVEYSSMTCPHCADFSANALPVIKADYIATGKVSLEMRNFVRDPVDVAASLVTRCNGAGPFFKMTEQLYADQRTWMERFSGLDQARQAEIGKLPENRQYAELAKIAGFDQFAQQRGVSADKLGQCLSDLGERDRLVQMNKTAIDQYKLTGTPTFLINGQETGVYDWKGLEPKLKAAVGA